LGFDFMVKEFMIVGYDTELKPDSGEEQSEA